MAARKGVSNSDLRAIIISEINNADGMASSELSIERGQNMDYYQARPFGNEIEGRSQVVSSDVADTVEWIMPTLMRIFTSGEDAVEFEPETPNDVEAAKQATQYTNFIWDRDNRGFLNFHSWFKDALISKNGVVKIWYDNTPRYKRERYCGLDETAFAYLVADENVEVSEHTENKQTVTAIVPDPKTGAMTPQDREVVTHDVVITRKLPGGRVKIVPVAPEEFLISREARSIEHARFVGHRRRRTLSDLVEEGYDKETVQRLAGDETSIQTDAEEIKRNTVEYVVPLGTETVNEAMRQVWVTEGYLLADVDGDGIAEMRKVVTAGSAYEILSNEAWDTPRPFASLTPIPMPHRYNGLCPADLVKDLQLIKSTVWRQYLDNLYLINNSREQVIEANIVDPQEVLSSAPGRKIRIKNGPAVFPIEVPDIGQAALAGLEYIDQVKENRTGVSQRTQGLDPDALNETATGQRIQMTAAMGKIELIARIFAETGVRDAFRLILKLICTYQNEPRVIRLTDKWVPMDPSQWNSDMDMTVRVGMGMGDKDQQLQHAMLIGQLQQAAAALGFVTPENLRNTADDICAAIGKKSSERYFTFPQPGTPPPQAKPDPEMVKAQGQLQLKQAELQSNVQLEQMKEQNAAALQQQKIQADAQASQVEAQSKAAVQQHLNQLEDQRRQAEQAGEQQIAQFKAQLQTQLEAQKLQAEKELELQKAYIQQQTAIEVARINAKATTGEGEEALAATQANAPIQKDSADVSQKLDALLAELVQQRRQPQQDIAGALNNLAASHAASVQALQSEKEVVRDPKTGKVTGVRVKQQPNDILSKVAGG